jgi:hypothetical protein
MASQRTSLEARQEQDKHLEAAKRLQSHFEGSDLQLEKHLKSFGDYRLDADDLEDGEEVKLKDPAIVASDVTSQIVRCLSLLGTLLTFATGIPSKAQIPIS